MVTTTANNLLIDLHARGMALHIEGQRLRIDDATSLTDVDRASIVRNKTELLAILRSATGAPATPAGNEQVNVAIATALANREATTGAISEGHAKIESDASRSSACTDHLARLSLIDPSTTSNWWRIHYADCAPRLVSTTPTANADEMQRVYPAAASVEPYSPPVTTPDCAMTATDEAAICAWLVEVDETNPTIIADVIEQSQRDADARAYFLGRARVTK